MEALFDYHFGKIKTRKKSLSKENEKNRFKDGKKKLRPFCQAKKKNLAESDKGSWVVRRFLDVLFFSASFSAFNPYGAGFAFAFIFGLFAHYYVVVLN